MKNVKVKPKPYLLSINKNSILSYFMEQIEFVKSFMELKTYDCKIPRYMFKIWAGHV